MDVAVAKLASDVLLLDVRQVTLIADYFIICSGSSDRQIQAIADDIRDGLKEQDVRPFSIEGDADSGWMVMDYSDVIVHIMSPAVRELYNLEDLWKNAKTVLRIE